MAFVGPRIEKGQAKVEEERQAKRRHEGEASERRPSEGQERIFLLFFFSELG